MHDIFISYAKEDKTHAKHLAQALEAKGFDVWYDIEIPTGTTFDNVIEKALEDTKCVVVLWSEHSIDSEWVKVEAAEGKSRDILVPVLIGDVKIPLAFRRRQTASLADWLNGIENDSFDRLVEDIRLIVPEDGLTHSEDTKDEARTKKNAKPTPPPPKKNKWVKLAIIAGAVVIAFFGWWKISSDQKAKAEEIKTIEQQNKALKEAERAADSIRYMEFRRSKIVHGNKFEGGIIFYIDETKDHGLIMSQGDQTPSPIFWLESSSNTKTDKAEAYDTGIFDGKTNTDKIVAKFGVGNYPAKICDELEIEGYTDWYLPSQKELDLLYENKSLGDFTPDYYWSSTEIANSDVYYMSFHNGKSYEKLAAQNDYNFQNKAKVRAIRKF